MRLECALQAAEGEKTSVILFSNGPCVQQYGSARKDAPAGAYWHDGYENTHLLSGWNLRTAP